MPEFSRDNRSRSRIYSALMFLSHWWFTSRWVRRLHPLSSAWHISRRSPEIPMADTATTVGALPHGKSLLDKKMKPASAWVSGVVVSAALLAGLAYIGVHV